MKKTIRLVCLLAVLAAAGIIFKLYFWGNAITAVSELQQAPTHLQNKSGTLIAEQNGKLRLEVSARTIDPKYGNQKLKIKAKGRVIGQGEMKLERKSRSSVFDLTGLQPGECYSDIIVEFSSGDILKKLCPPLTPVNIPFNMTLKGNALTVSLADKNDPDIFPLAPFKVKINVQNEKHKRIATILSELDKVEKLDIPGNGEFTITIEIEDYHEDTIGRRTIAYKDGKARNLSDDSKPVTLAVASFLDFTGTYDGHVIVTVAARDRVVSDLVQNYDCVVISRANGLALSTENILNRLNAADKGTPVGFIPAADYAIIGYFARNTVLDNGYLDDFITTVFMTDLRNNNNKEIKDVFPGEYRTGYNEEIVPEIAAKLNLRPKTQKHQPMTEKQLDETWAILPFSKLISSDSYAIAKSDADLSLKMELTLQESGKLKKIVDHSEIDKIMQESKISMANGISESTAAGIARILGAEKVVTGQISKSKIRCDERFRLDLFLIDGKKAVVLDAASAICAQNAVEQTAAKLLMKFTKMKYTVPKFPSQSQQMRIKEAAIYQSFLDTISDHGGAKYLSIKAGSNLTEAAYMLLGNDPVKTYKLANCFLKDIIMVYDDVIGKTDEGKKAVALIEKLLENIPATKETPYPLVLRANAQLIVGNNENAISLIDRYLDSHPAPIYTYAYYIKGQALYNMGDYKAAAELAEKSKNYNGGVRLAIDSYNKLGNDKKEFNALGNLAWNAFSVNNAVRFMQLARKFEGAEYAFKRYENFESKRQVHPAMLLELAKCHIDLNNKSEAAMILENLSDEKNLADLQTDKDAFLKEVKEKLDKLRDIKINWKTPAQIRTIPEQYKFYIRPIGNPDMEIIKDTAAALEKNIGGKVIVLPCMPMPDDDGSYEKEYNQYNIKFARYRIIWTLPIPDDAIMLVNITNLDIFYPGHTFVTSSLDLKYGTYLSYARTGGILKREYGPLFGKVMTSLMLEYAFSCVDAPDLDDICWGRKCTNFPCVDVQGGNTERLMKKSFAMCPACQENYKRVDFDKLNYVWKNTYKNLPSLDDDNVALRRNQQYRDKIKKFQAEQKKEEKKP